MIMGLSGKDKKRGGKSPIHASYHHFITIIHSNMKRNKKKNETKEK